MNSEGSRPLLVDDLSTTAVVPSDSTTVACTTAPGGTRSWSTKLNEPGLRSIERVRSVGREVSFRQGHDSTRSPSRHRPECRRSADPVVELTQLQFRIKQPQFRCGRQFRCHWPSGGMCGPGRLFGDPPHRLDLLRGHVLVLRISTRRSPSSAPQIEFPGGIWLRKLRVRTRRPTPTTQSLQAIRRISGRHEQVGRATSIDGSPQTRIGPIDDHGPGRTRRSLCERVKVHMKECVTLSDRHDRRNSQGAAPHGADGGRRPGRAPVGGSSTDVCSGNPPSTAHGSAHDQVGLVVGEFLHRRHRVAMHPEILHDPGFRFEGSTSHQTSVQDQVGSESEDVGITAGSQQSANVHHTVRVNRTTIGRALRPQRRQSPEVRRDPQGSGQTGRISLLRISARRRGLRRPRLASRGR